MKKYIILKITNNNDKEESYMNVLQKIALIVVIVGALNWGLIGLFNFNLVAFIFDNMSVVISRIIYALIGVAGIICISALFIADHNID